jgi:putative tryptophan/tyrosine transport system substrate-binding protein
VSARRLVALALAITLPTGMATAQTKVRRVATLSPVGTDVLVQDHFLRGLRELGWVEGQNVVLDRRSSEGHPERLAPLAAEIVRARPDVVVAVSPPAVDALRKATTMVPIVALDLETDPVRSGLAASVARPGGQVTGLYLDVPELQGKWLQLLREVVPRLSHAAVLCDPQTHGPQLRATEAAAGPLGIQLRTHQVRTPNDFAPAFEAIAAQRPDALIILAAPLHYREAPRIVEFALKRRLPSIALFREFPAAGGLMSYGVVLPDLFFRAARYVDRILKGTRPGELPIELLERFELTVNRKTAAALGITLPPSLLLRANEVIQ